MPLTDADIRSAKPRAKPYKLFDERGLYLLVHPSGGRWWRLKYRFGGKEWLLSLGTYPDTSLKLARDKREEARRQLAAGTNPSVTRKAEKEARADTFEVLAREWLDAKHKVRRNDNAQMETYQRKAALLETHVFPHVGASPITKVSTRDLLAVLKRIEKAGKHETAHRARAHANAIFRYAIANGKAELNPAANLIDALAPVVVKHRAAITDPEQLGKLLREIYAYQGQPATVAALRLLPLVFTRPGELRSAEWSEFTLDGKEPVWRVPASRMKMRIEHWVPLSRQAVAVLKALEPISGGGRYVFPSLRGGHRPISENTVNVALRTMGYDGDTMTGHGFRATARTILDEVLGQRPDIIEHQLAHAVKDANGRAYNRTSHLPQRFKMMQGWADYLDRLRLEIRAVPAATADAAA